MLKRLGAGVCIAALSLAYVGPAAAFDCTVAKKPANAGSAYLLTFGPGSEEPTNVEPLKRNPGDDDKTHGGFVTLTDGQDTVSTFVHAPQGVLPPVRDGGPQDNCDGKGLESIEECFN